MLKKISDFLFPKIDKEVQNAVDARSLNNTRNTCQVIFIFEAVSLILFVATRKEWDDSAWVSLSSVIICLMLCLAGGVCSHRIASMKKISHFAVIIFNSCYYILFSLWAVHVAVRNYARHEQILTFFAAQLLMVCFLQLSHIHSLFFSTFIYALMYYYFYTIDRAAGVNIFNYVLLLIATITGMMVSFRSQVNAAAKAVELEKSNEQLFYNNRHDGLTGLRNRKALLEDVPKVLNKPVTAYMIDVNSFKNINDTYGHAVGDTVIRETAKWLRSRFDGDRCYRYGGDEFLVLCEHGEHFPEETEAFCVPEMPDRQVDLSIGYAEGEPKSHDELFEIVSRADNKLYDIKARIHQHNKA